MNQYHDRCSEPGLSIHCLFDYRERPNCLKRGRNLRLLVAGRVEASPPGRRVAPSFILKVNDVPPPPTTAGLILLAMMCGEMFLRPYYEDSILPV